MAHYVGLSYWASFKVFCLLGKKEMEKKKKSARLCFFSAARLSILFKKCFCCSSPSARKDEEGFGVFRENFIQPVVLHVPSREFAFLCQGSES